MSDKCVHVWRTNTQHRFKGWKCTKCGLEEHNVELVLREKLSRYEMVRVAAKQIFDAVDIKGDKVCPHGNSGAYPIHGWFCDDCFFQLKTALEATRNDQAT